MQPFKPILFPTFFNLSTFILGSPFTPEGQLWEGGIVPASNMDQTDGFQCIGHTICSLSSWFCSQIFPPFYPAFHNNPLVSTASARGERTDDVAIGEQRRGGPSVARSQGADLARLGYEFRQISPDSVKDPKTGFKMSKKKILPKKPTKIKKNQGAGMPVIVRKCSFSSVLPILPENRQIKKIARNN